MKQIILTLLIRSVFLTACAGPPPLPQPKTDPVPSTSTPSPFLSSTPSAFVIPTEPLESVSCLPKPIQIAPSNGSYIGLQTPPELNGIKNLDALLIESGDEFSVGLNLILKGENQYLFWLERFCDNQAGQRFPEVIDEIVLRPLNKDEFAIPTCYLENKMSSRTIAIGYYREEIVSGKTYKKVIATQAWLKNFNNWTFIEIPKEQLGNVLCIHETS